MNDKTLGARLKDCYQHQMIWGGSTAGALLVMEARREIIRLKKEIRKIKPRTDEREGK